MTHNGPMMNDHQAAADGAEPGRSNRSEDGGGPQGAPGIVSPQGHVCASCARTWFPRPLVCPACGGRAWGSVTLSTGRVTQVTTRIDSEEGPITLAEVRADQGPILLARCLGDVETAARVRLATIEGTTCASVIDI